MQQGPGGAAELRDVGRTVFGESGWERSAFFGLAAKGEEGGHVVTCATSGEWFLALSPLCACAMRAESAAFRPAHCVWETHGLPSAS